MDHLETGNRSQGIHRAHLQNQQTMLSQSMMNMGQEGNIIYL